MDPRIRRTKASIVNAFIQLRAKKPLEKITIRELTQLAGINKATFYLHYQDIYDLSHQLETEMIQSILGGIQHPEYFLTAPARFTQELHGAILGQGALLRIVFPESQSLLLADRLEQGLLDYLEEHYPDQWDSTGSQQARVILSYMVYGSYFAYIRHPQEPDIVNTVSEISETILRHYRGQAETTGENGDTMWKSPL